MATEEQHLTTARLSAYIDGQLSTEEQQQTDLHLQECTVCRQQLAELRETVALLHALPQPSLPRSFVLPVPERTLSSSQTVRPAPRLAPVVPLSRRSGWPSYVSGAVRTVSTLAALIGIVFLLSALFGTVIPSGGSATTAHSSATATSVPGQTLPRGVLGTPVQVTTPTNSGSVPKPNSQANKPVGQNPLQALLILFTIETIPTRTSIGIALVLLAVVGFLIVRRM